MGFVKRSFFSDTRAADTIPLKMVFYLVITGVIIVLMALAWNNISPFYSGMEDENQINNAALEIRSIQAGYPRNLLEPDSPEGSTCSIELSMPHISYLAFGVDPDPDMNGNLDDSYWVQENNTIICQYVTGARERYHIEGDNIFFRKGMLDDNGNWVLDNDPDSNKSMGLVIEGPVEGTFNLELVLSDRKYTLSHF